MVLAIFADTTSPIFSFLLPCLVSAIRYPLLLLRAFGAALGFACAFAFGAAAAFLAAGLGAAFTFALPFAAGLALAALAVAGTWDSFFAGGSRCNSRSLSTVNMRARSFLSDRNFFNPSICPIDIWNRSRN